MINCLTQSEKFLTFWWVVAGWIFIAIATQIAGGIGAFFALTLWLSTLFFVKNRADIFEKFYHIVLAACNSPYSTGKINRWMVENEIIHRWEVCVGQTGCNVNIENIRDHLYNEYDYENEELEKINSNFARKSISKEQARNILKSVAGEIVIVRDIYEPENEE